MCGCNTAEIREGYTIWPWVRSTNGWGRSVWAGGRGTASPNERKTVDFAVKEQNQADWLSACWPLG